MKGVFVVEGRVGDLPAARGALARAVASGAFGPGYTVELDGDGVRFRGAHGGRLDLTSDGRATYQVATGRRDLDRVAEAVVVALVVAALATLGWSAIVIQALIVGGATGGAYGLVRIARDRQELRRRIRSLVASLPVLVDARRQ